MLAASRILYDVIINNTESAIEKARDGQEFSMIFGISLNDKISVSMAGGKDWTYSVNHLLYGKRIDESDYTKREDECEKYNFINPWIAAQLYFRTKGKYLIDISDCTKKTKNGKYNYDEAFFRVYHTAPKQRFDIWHKHANVPYFFKTDLVLESKELEHMWAYLKSDDEVREIYDRKREEAIKQITLKKTLAAEIREEKAKHKKQFKAAAAADAPVLAQAEPEVDVVAVAEAAVVEDAPVLAQAKPEVDAMAVDVAEAPVLAQAKPEVDAMAVDGDEPGTYAWWEHRMNDATPLTSEEEAIVHKCGGLCYLRQYYKDNGFGGIERSVSEKHHSGCKRDSVCGRNVDSEEQDAEITPVYTYDWWEHRMHDPTPLTPKEEEIVGNCGGLSYLRQYYREKGYGGAPRTVSEKHHFECTCNSVCGRNFGSNDQC